MDFGERTDDLKFLIRDRMPNAPRRSMSLRRALHAGLRNPCQAPPANAICERSPAAPGRTPSSWPARDSTHPM
jgi:hypothetical protein